MSQNVSKLLLVQLDIGNRSSALVNNFSGIEISTNGLLFTDCRQTRRRWILQLNLEVFMTC